MNTNKKNKRERRQVSLDKKAHQRFKMLAAKRDQKLEVLIDDAAWKFLKTER